MTPGVGANEGAEFLVRLERLSGQLLPIDQPFGLQPFGDAAHKADPADHGRKILPRGIAALFEIAESDLRRIARIGGAERHLPGAVLGMRLQNRPA